MEFGSEKIFSVISKCVETGNVEKYNELCSVILKDTQMLLRKKGVHPQLRDDIAQDVCISVLNHLVDFYSESVNKNSNQRNAWLGRIVINKVNDYYRKSSESVTLVDFSELEEIIAGDPEEDIVLRDESKRAMLAALEAVTQINTKPENIIAFFLNKLTADSSQGRKNGMPQKVSEILCGMTLANAYHYLINQLECELHYRIPEETFRLLRERINQDSDRVISLSARSITDKTNWITSKMREREGGM